jgi:hypothetical protein
MDIAIFQPIFLIKVITLIALGFYIIFTFVVFTQIRAMGRIIGLPLSPTIFKTVIIVNIVLAISLFLFALVIL